MDIQLVVSDDSGQADYCSTGLCRPREKTPEEIYQEFGRVCSGKISKSRELEDLIKDQEAVGVKEEE